VKYQQASEYEMNTTCNALLVALGIALTACAALAAEPNAENSDMLKAVVHVNFAEADRQEAGLKNIENILKEAADAEIEVVCHGEGLSMLNSKESRHSDLVKSLMKRGVGFVACENTMKKKSVTKSDLIEGSATVPSGAVEVIRKQSDGYGYFRP
jgi:intracellular sulfur oxidation DsrE/DsrF family protein